MKNDEQMYQSVLSRRNAYRERTLKRIRTVRRTVPVLACFCLVMVLGFEYWSHLEKLPNAPIPPTVAEDQTTGTTESTTSSNVHETTETSAGDQADPYFEPISACFTNAGFFNCTKERKNEFKRKTSIFVPCYGIMELSKL